MSSTPLTKLASFSSLAEAQLFSTLLEKNQIECTFRNEYMSQILPFASHDIVVYVQIDTLDEARDLHEAWKAANKLYQYKEEEKKSSLSPVTKLNYVAWTVLFLLVALYLIFYYF